MIIINNLTYQNSRLMRDADGKEVLNFFQNSPGSLKYTSILDKHSRSATRLSHLWER